MSRIQKFANAAVLSMILGSSAFAASAADHSRNIAANSEGGSMPTITATASMQFMDYTGAVPEPKADGLAVWTAAGAHDYTGVAAAPTEAQLALAPVWNAGLVHEFMAQ